MLTPSSHVACLFVFLFACSTAQAQITIDGTVFDVKKEPVGGVDITIYIPGTSDPVASKTSEPGTGKYRFDDLTIDGAFDIVFVHSKYEPVIVSRLAEHDNQHVSKVIFEKGSRMPASALFEHLQSIGRASLLADSIPNDKNRMTFKKKLLSSGIGDISKQSIDSIVTVSPNDRIKALLTREMKSAAESRESLQQQ